ncbi:unnamed protein product [Adineta steineri]|uniref:Uncharacterized protein n=1 Tax=Adineta steineri TaxID=433720 RepID=A0A815XT76_9BILA|nr:unnamed protein product [Adineta steineri]CAF1561433.1 unnamed protein product [Adineta steineri]
MGSALLGILGFTKIFNGIDGLLVSKVNKHGRLKTIEKRKLRLEKTSAATRKCTAKGLPRIEIAKTYASYFINNDTTDKIGSALLGVLGFTVAIPAQCVFPAPWRSFAIEQMALMFLPKWFNVFSIVFDCGTVFTLDFDREEQESAIIALTIHPHPQDGQVNCTIVD